MFLPRLVKRSFGQSWCLQGVRWLLALLLFGVTAVAFAADFDAAVQSLNGENFTVKEASIGDVVDTGHERSSTVLESMLNGLLYYRKSDGRMVIVAPVEQGYQVQDAASGEDLGVLGKRKVRKIAINNALRTSLRNALARLSLSSTERDVRYAAVQEMLGTMNKDSRALLEDRLAMETDERVRDLLGTALALYKLDSQDRDVRLQAVQDLDGSIIPQVRNRLVGLLASENDAEINRVLKQVLGSIDARLQLYSLAETAFFGLSLGSVLLLAAIGLAITFGVMGVINMAHGELIMLGAYTTYLVQSALPGHVELSLLVAVPAAFMVSGAFGIAIERGVIRFLYGRPLETLLATFGISLILQQLVRSTISAQNVTVSNPNWMSGSLHINEAFSLTYNRIYILIFSLVVFFALLAILKKTSLGLQVRAVSQNRPMAKAMGIRSEWVDAMTFGLGSGIAGIAGVALSQLTNVGPNMGQSYIIDSFMVVVFGGVGNLWGTMVGAMSLGVANKILEPWSGAVLAKILVLVFIILFIQKRPRGLFPQQGRAAEH